MSLRVNGYVFLLLNTFSGLEIELFFHTSNLFSSETMKKRKKEDKLDKLNMGMINIMIFKSMFYIIIQIKS